MSRREGWFGRIDAGTPSLTAIVDKLIAAARSIEEGMIVGNDKQPSPSVKSTEPTTKSTEPTTKSTEPTKPTSPPAKTEEDKDIENKSKNWGDRLKGVIRNPGKPGNPAN